MINVFSFLTCVAIDVSPSSDQYSSSKSATAPMRTPPDNDHEPLTAESTPAKAPPTQSAATSQTPSQSDEVMPSRIIKNHSALISQQDNHNTNLVNCTGHTRSSAGSDVSDQYNDLDISSRGH